MRVCGRAYVCVCVRAEGGKVIPQKLTDTSHTELIEEHQATC